MRHLLNIVFVSATALFVFAPTVGLGGVFEVLMLVVALAVGCVSVAEGLIRAGRALRQIEAEVQSGVGA
ncbi:hypothetical protein [Mycolicibacterium peregrinum]|nr:hypothetical protein [Mycolicibacterium peregrinum]